MKRSAANAAIRAAKRAFSDAGWSLPRFADLSPDDWLTDRHDLSEVVNKGLGWDVTDFGTGDFDRTGLVLFTLRNGATSALEAGTGKVYAEKLMFVDVGQVTPWHFHRVKQEDIINRSGGVLAIRFASKSNNGKLGTDPIAIVCDQAERLIEALQVVRLEPGESVSIPTGIYHTFSAERFSVVAGEVSGVNDDSTDNVFLEDVGRYPALVEDERPIHRLVSDYMVT